MEDNEDPTPITFPSAVVAAASPFNNDPTLPNGSSAASSAAASSYVIISPAIRTYIETTFLTNLHNIQYILSSQRTIAKTNRQRTYEHLICLIYALLQICAESDSYDLYKLIVSSLRSDTKHIPSYEIPKMLRDDTTLPGPTRQAYGVLYEQLIYGYSWISDPKEFKKQNNGVSKSMKNAKLDKSDIIRLAKQDIMERRNPMLSFPGLSDLYRDSSNATEGGSHKKRRNYKKKNSTKKRRRQSKTRKNRRSLR